MNDVSESWGSPADPNGTGFEDAVAKLEREDILRIEALRAANAYYTEHESAAAYRIVKRAKEYYDFLSTGR